MLHNIFKFEAFTIFKNPQLYRCFIFRPAPKDEDEMMVAIFESIDRLFGIVRPRKVGKLFLKTNG